MFNDQNAKSNVCRHDGQMNLIAQRRASRYFIAAV
jgi:hypothetical protein